MAVVVAEVTPPALAPAPTTPQSTLYNCATPYEVAPPSQLPAVFSALFMAANAARKSQTHTHTHSHTYIHTHDGSKGLVLAPKQLNQT